MRQITHFYYSKYKTSLFFFSYRIGILLEQMETLLTGLRLHHQVCVKAKMQKCIQVKGFIQWMRSRLIDTLSRIFKNFLVRRFGLNILGWEPLIIKGRERRESVMLECVLRFSGFAVKCLPSLQVSCLAFRLLWELSGFPI